MEISILTCPYCAAGISQKANVCEYCGHEYMISSFSSNSIIQSADLSKYVRSYGTMLKENPNDPGLNFSIGICHLKQGMYAKAFSHFNDAIDNDIGDSDAYFYTAISLLNGKKAFVNSKTDVDRAMEYVNTAIIINDREIYHLFLAYLKYDYYERKRLKISPNYRAELSIASNGSVKAEDIKNLFEIMKVDVPDW